MTGAELRAELTRRLNDYTQRHDDTVILDAEAVRAAEELTSLWAQPASDDASQWSDLYLLGWFRWYRSQTSETDGPRELDMAVRCFATLWQASSPEVRDALEIPEPLMWRVMAFNDPGDALDLAVLLAQDPPPADFPGDAPHAAAELFAGVGLYASDEDERRRAHVNLCDLLRRRYEEGHDPDALDGAVAAGRAGVALPSPQHLHGIAESLLGQALQARADTSGRPEDLDEAIGLFRACTGFPAPGTQNGVWTRAHHLLGMALLARWQRSHDPADLDAAASALRTAWKSGSHTEDGAEHALHLVRALLLYFKDGRTTNVLTVLREAELVLTELPQADARLRAVQAEIGVQRFLLTQDAADLEAAIPLAEQAWADISGASGASDGPDITGSDRWAALQNLAALYSARAGESDSVGHDLAVRHYEAALEALPADDPRTAAARVSLASGLVGRAGCNGDASDARRALLLLDQVLRELPAGDPLRSTAKLNEAVATGVMYRRSEPPDPGMLDRAIALYRDVLSADHRTRLFPSLQANLGTLLTSRFRLNGRIEDIDDAIRALEESTALTPAEHPQRASRQEKLGQALELRYQTRADLTDLDNQVAAYREALHASPENPAAMNLLGAVLAIRGEITGNEDSLTEAIALHRKAVDATTEPARRAGRLSSLGSALAAQANKTGDSAVLDEAVSVHEEAVRSCDPDDASRCHMNLAVSRIIRFEWRGALDDLNAGIESYRESLSTGRERRIEGLVNLANALVYRAGRLGSESDHHEAAQLYEQALDATSPRHPHRPGRLANVARSWMRRALATDDHTLGRKALALSREALELAMGTAHERRMRIALADHLHIQAGLDNNADTVREGLRVLDPLTAGPPEGDVLQSRAELLRELYRLTGDAGALDDRVDTAFKAAACPGKAGDRAQWTYSLAMACWQRYRAAGRPKDLASAIDAWRLVCADDAAPAQLRFDAAAYWGNTAASAGKWDTAVEGFRRALDLYGQLAWPGLRRTDQEYRLAHASGVARDAAACALQRDDPCLAVELLEQGRSALWNLALDVTTDLDDLAQAAPALARRLDEVHAALRALSSTDTSSTADTAGLPHPATSVKDDDRRVRLAHERDRLLTRVRNLRGFEDFLSAPAYHRLTRAAAEGPVIVLNISSYRSDAIIMTQRGTPVVVRLSQAADEEQATLRANDYIHALQQLQDAAASGALGEMVKARMRIRAALDWLWTAVTAPVLDRLPDSETSTQRRVWWCPTGPLAVFPLHAAGPATETTAVIDHVVSSYTPTLRALIRARQRPAPHDAPRLLLMAVPDAPHQHHLPQAVPEVERIAAAHPAQYTLVTRDQATRQRALEELPRHTWAHFSCHGGQDFSRPSRGGLFLADGMLTVHDMAEQTSSQAELAFLSACQTAIGGTGLLDESIHLAAALATIGFRHVIATLWSIYDSTSPEVAAQVYTALRHSGTAAPRSVAEALHKALLHMRKSHPNQLTVWAPYIHIGP
ncbi:CHAT domain-containing protein [Streptomyces sp. S.PB5]|uniref:CHAT domain-containing protein n=1 Tax=Streptomyces sp. S.PB5 TaxID=3020844 RepID=UPI0025B04B42|nr:CHAT domain-containing protein [Streptomyces sp. S.PB5]MDN3027160.1 CHAT domain-containing protein [Streptomyces sp. S.PB5]